MGSKRVSVRRLSDGTKVRHHPPDDIHPEGRLELIRESSPLRDVVLRRRTFLKRQLDGLRANHRKRVEFKLERQRRGGLPPEKSSV